jgi:hypothetical protein
MKKSIIYLGVLALTFSNIVSASDSNLSFQQEEVMAISNSDEVLVHNSVFAIKDTILPELNIMVAKSYQKSIEDIINENNDITESQPLEAAYIESAILEQYNVFTIAIDKIQFVSTEKTIDQIVEEDNQIVNNNEVTESLPLFYQKTIEDIILQDSMIIDSKLDNEVKPLDFEKINAKYVKPTNMAGIATIN